MTLPLELIKDNLANINIITAFDIVRDGSARIATPFPYPEGSAIDVFLSPTDDPLKPWLLSDKGQTTAYLLDIHVKPWATSKRKQIVADICESLQVVQRGGEYCISLSEFELATHLSSAVFRLVQACIRIADLAMTQRLRTSSIFREDIEECVETVGLKYEADIALEGRFGKMVPVDFRVFGNRTISLMQTLSTGNAAAAHSLVNETFRRWYDLERYRAEHTFITVLDSSQNLFREDDISRISDLSNVILFPAQREILQEMLVA